MTYNQQNDHDSAPLNSIMRIKLSVEMFINLMGRPSYILGLHLMSR